MDKIKEQLGKTLSTINLATKLLREADMEALKEQLGKTLSTLHLATKLLRSEAENIIAMQLRLDALMVKATNGQAPKEDPSP